MTRWLALAGAACLLVAAAARPALAIDAGGVDKLNKQALEAFDGLNFDQAKSLLEKAISDAGESGLGKDLSVARAHLNLGMVLIAGFQQRDEAIEHFKAALAIQPKIVPPAGVFNPETQAAFDEAKQSAASEREAQIAALAPPRPARPAARVKKAASSEGEGEAEGEKEGGAHGGSGFYVAFGIGSGGGIARGNLDTNKNLLQMRPDGTKVLDNSWSGGFATSRLGHLTLDAGYFVLPDLLISLEGRLQFVSGTSDVVASPPSCPTSCSPPSTGIAVLAKGSLFLLSGPVRPFVVGGLGGGAIRQVVKLNVKPDETDSVTTHCGSTGKDACVDTVTGGPFLIAAGGGVAYEVGSLAFLASLVSNIGIPHFMLNFDLTLGVGLRL
jgi:hypothetical protein